MTSSDDLQWVSDLLAADVVEPMPQAVHDSIMAKLKVLATGREISEIEPPVGRDLAAGARPAEFSRPRFDTSSVPTAT